MKNFMVGFLERYSFLNKNIDSAGANFFPYFPLPARNPDAMPGRDIAIHDHENKSQVKDSRRGR
jgi:hypothetical protein